MKRLLICLMLLPLLTGAKIQGVAPSKAFGIVPAKVAGITFDIFTPAAECTTELGGYDAMWLYKLDEASGTATAIENCTNTLSLPHSGSGTTAVTGLVSGNARDFNGSGWLQSSLNAGLFTTNPTEYSIKAVFAHEYGSWTATTYYGIVTTWRNTAVQSVGPFYIDLYGESTTTASVRAGIRDSGGTGRTQLNSNLGCSFLLDATTDNGVTHTAEIRGTASGYFLYIDDALCHSVGTSYALDNASDTPLVIGGDVSGSSALGFQGVIDHVSIRWNNP